MKVKLLVGLVGMFMFVAAGCNAPQAAARSDVASVQYVSPKGYGYKTDKPGPCPICGFALAKKES